ncbi:hypothetical protein V8F33_013260 [Rhypophila sp. PSN 637]
MAEGREQLDRGHFETSFQIFANALERCETISVLAPLKYQVLGNLGWVDRLAGQALALADAASDSNTMTRSQIESELGTVFRLMDRHEEAEAAFARQYSIATVRQQEDVAWRRVHCRAIGNLAMANYQRALQLNPNDPHIKRKTRYHDDHAISQLEQRINLAVPLSLCYTAISDLDPNKGKAYWMDKAVKAAKDGVDMPTSHQESALPLSRFFYGRALLHSADDNNGPNLKAKALEQFKNTDTPETITPAIALAMEPSTEHRRYLRELVAAGADLTCLDPNTGYTALDYAVFAGDSAAESIILDGLRQQLLSTAGEHEDAVVEAQVEQQRTEARLRKGYREMFREKLRPILLQSRWRWHNWQYGSEDVKDALLRETIDVMRSFYGDDTLDPDRMTTGIMFDDFRRRDTILALRKAYADALAAGRESDGERMFDQLRAIRYSDFAQFGRLPRSSDGLAMPLMDFAKLDLGDGQGHIGSDEFIIFFSYRWINHDPGANAPDDANQTQYKRMIAAVESYLAHKETPDIPPEKLYIWMDFACVDQDNPSTGVSALPLIIAQCDAVITLQDDDYFDRAWCCVEALLTQTLRDIYHVLSWFQQVPARKPGENTVPDESGRWELRYMEHISRLTLAGTKLTHESDRPKVMFLERQCGLVR